MLLLCQHGFSDSEAAQPAPRVSEAQQANARDVQVSEVSDGDADVEWIDSACGDGELWSETGR